MLWNTILGCVKLSSYQFLSGVYDLLMDDVEDELWSEYLVELLKSKGIHPPSSILETACGTGRVTLPLAQSGYKLTALDISEEMLQRAQDKIKRAGTTVDFVSGDMRDFTLPKPVDAVICACDGINYLVRDTDVRCFFESCKKNLVVGGVLLFDMGSYNKLTNILGNNVFYDDRDDVTCLWQNRLSKDLLHIGVTLFIKEGYLYRRMDEEHIQRAYKIKKIAQMMRQSGFGSIQSLRFKTKDEAKEEDERIQFIAVKE